MPLRKLLFPSLQPQKWKAPPRAVVEAPSETPSAPERRSLWRSGLLIATSAAFGGIAVAIWNRRTLATCASKATSMTSRTEMQRHGGP